MSNRHRLTSLAPVDESGGGGKEDESGGDTESGEGKAAADASDSPV